jgi:lipopolysaccharide/colanic/teichoic acid biosynthesis glycosyltransferase
MKVSDKRVVLKVNSSLKEDNYVNLGLVKNIPHEELFHEVSIVIAEENLEYVNAHSRKVSPRHSFYTRYGKRIIDIIVSVAAIVITLPVNVVLGFCTVCDVGRPIIFKQERVGIKEKPFTILKFRNMSNATDEKGLLLPPDQRVTKFGKFVRKTSLDELLNFWSILKGEMSIIGPRPLPYDYLNFYSDRHRMRFSVRPGLECPLLYAAEDKVIWSDKFENDIYYIENVSFLLDIKMIFALVRMVFDKEGTAIRGNAIRGSFMGYNRNGTSINSQKVQRNYFEKAIRRMGYEENKY